MVLLRENLERGGLSMRDLVGSLYDPGNTHQPDKKLINVRRGEGGGERRGGPRGSPPARYPCFHRGGGGCHPPHPAPPPSPPSPHPPPPPPPHSPAPPPTCYLSP